MKHFIFKPLHMDYVVAAANLRAFMYGIPSNKDYDYIARKASEVHVPEFKPKSGIKIAVTDSEAQEHNAPGL